MMDHCLASETDIGGYGCDNMTVIIIALLHGKSSEEWYDYMASGFNKSSAVVPFEEKQQPNDTVKESDVKSEINTPNHSDTKPQKTA
ncbi:hypothetical protein BC941DRAFT_438967 [Chlamydoabsidia padenii]|nr:hypothetical protein BC941DRAFT_438967 [Chlamydoabsidia padenii]